MSRGNKERAVMKGEEYLNGRRAGVEGTYGAKRAGGAEKTVYPGGESEGGGEDSLPNAAGSIYAKAVRNGGGSDTGGDAALRDR
jgi:hypothetical protein